MNDEQAPMDYREKLVEAIKQFLVDNEDYDGMLSDWMLITSQSHVHDDGSTGTSYSVFVNAHQPIHSSAGLLKYASIKNEHYILCNGHNLGEEEE